MALKILSRTLMLVLALFLATSITASAQDEDEATGVDEFAAEGIEPIPVMTEGNIILNFDGYPEGPTSLDALGIGSCITGFTFTTRSGTGSYDFQTGGGRALAANPDGSGGLYIVDPPDGIYGNADFLTIDLVSEVTKFGFEIGDWSGPFSAEIFNNGVSLGSITVSTEDDNRTHLFSSDAPFDRVVLSAAELFDSANWVVPSLILPIIPGCALVRPIPTLSEWGLIAMAGVLGLIGFFAIRRRKATA